MEEEIKHEFERIWKKLREVEDKISTEKIRKKKETQLKSDRKIILQNIFQSQIRLIDYPVDICESTMEKCLLALKLVKDIGIEDSLLTIEIRAVLENKLRAKNTPSMSMISNAMKKAEKEGYVTSLPVKSRERRQRKYKIHEEGKEYIQRILEEKKNDKKS